MSIIQLPHSKTAAIFGSSARSAHQRPSQLGWLTFVVAAVVLRHGFSA